MSPAKWLDTTEKRLKLTGAALGLAVMLGPGLFWVSSYFAKASEVRTEFVSVRRDVAEVIEQLDVIKLELKIGQLETRRSVLRSELRQLSAVSNARTSMEAARLAVVSDELRDIEKDIDVLRQVQARLPGSK